MAHVQRVQDRMSVYSSKLQCNKVYGWGKKDHTVKHTVGLDTAWNPAGKRGPIWLEKPPRRTNEAPWKPFVHQKSM
jgi:hypothetical protein